MFLVFPCSLILLIPLLVSLVAPVSHLVPLFASVYIYFSSLLLIIFTLILFMLFCIPVYSPLIFCVLVWLLNIFELVFLGELSLWLPVFNLHLTLTGKLSFTTSGFPPFGQIFLISSFYSLFNLFSWTFKDQYLKSPM